MDELQVFTNISFGQVRVQELDNEVWFDKFRAMHPNRA